MTRHDRTAQNHRAKKVLNNNFKDDMAVNFKPSFYTATIVFSAVVISTILLFVAVIMISKEWAKHLKVFTLVFSVLGLAVVVLSFIRILKLEADCAAKQGSGDTSYKLLTCPDAYETTLDGCVAPSEGVVLTADKVLLGDLHVGRRFVHTPAAPVTGVNESRKGSRQEFLSSKPDSGTAAINYGCEYGQWKGIPWTSLRALCPDAKQPVSTTTTGN